LCVDLLPLSTLSSSYKAPVIPIPSPLSSPVPTRRRSEEDKIAEKLGQNLVEKIKNKREQNKIEDDTLDAKEDLQMRETEERELRRKKRLEKIKTKERLANLVRENDEVEKNMQEFEQCTFEYSRATTKYPRGTRCEKDSIRDKDKERERKKKQRQEKNDRIKKVGEKRQEIIASAPNESDVEEMDVPEEQTRASPESGTNETPNVRKNSIQLEEVFN
jgi:hypothetical protein